MIALARLFLVVAGYAAAGELVLRRRSRSLVSWNEAFWTGAAVFAAALIVGSLFVRSALGLLTALLPAAVLMDVAFRFGRGKARVDESRLASARHLDRRMVAPLTIAGVVAIAFVALNGRAGFVTDGFDIWTSKAMVLGIEQHLDPADGEPERLGRVANYAPILPLTEALVARRRDRFDFPAAKLVFPVFFVSLLAGTWGIARRLLRPDLAAWAVAIVALLPAVSTDWNAGGFADMPMAAAVVAAAGAWMGRLEEAPDRPLADVWIAGGMPLIKPEGFVLVACGLFASLFAGRRRGGRRLPATVLPLAGFLAVSLLFRHRFGVAEGQYGPLDAAHWSMAARRLVPVAARCLAQAFSVRLWGPFWIVAGPAVAVGMFRREGSVRALSGFVALSSLAFCSIFLFSNWGFPGSAAYGHRSLDFEIEGGFPRILEQIAAPAAVIVVAGWNAISASSEERAKSAAALRAAASP